jgi:hypothetical protein
MASSFIGLSCINQRYSPSTQFFMKSLRAWFNDYRDKIGVHLVISQWNTSYFGCAEMTTMLQNRDAKYGTMSLSTYS